METIPINQCIKIGVLQKPHGVNGKMYLYFEEEFDGSVNNAHIFYVKIDNLLVPFFIEDNMVEVKDARRALVKFRWVDTGEKAREYSGLEVYLKKGDIDKGKTSLEDTLTGFQVLSHQKNIIGIISEVNNYSGNIVLTVESEAGQTLIPYNENLVKKLDIKDKILCIHIPDGLLPRN